MTHECDNPDCFGKSVGDFFKAAKTHDVGPAALIQTITMTMMATTNMELADILEAVVVGSMMQGLKTSGVGPEEAVQILDKLTGSYKPMH